VSGGATSPGRELSYFCPGVARWDIYRSRWVMVVEKDETGSAEGIGGTRMTARRRYRIGSASINFL